MSSAMFHHVLPIHSGDQVAVIGRPATPLVTSLADAGVNVIVAEYGATPPRPPADYAIVPAVTTGALEPLCRELAEWVRPGGSVLLASTNAAHLPRRRPFGWTRRQGARALGRNGFTGIEVYGIRSRLKDPQTLVPLDHAGALRWYATSGFQPRSTPGALMVRLLGRLPAGWLGPLLFPALAFVARRDPADGGTA